MVILCPECQGELLFFYCEGVYHTMCLNKHILNVATAVDCLEHCMSDNVNDHTEDSWTLYK